MQQTGLTASITAKTLNVTGLTASDRVYDTTTVASLGGTAAVSALSGDTVTVGGTAAGAFADKNVGTAKTITVSGVTISGTDATNYTLVQQTGLTASITAATLTYNATAVTTASGTTPSVNSGTVTGFVTGESQNSATTGTLLFSTTATSSSSAGSYAITGSGLTSNQGNYIFTQASGNNNALTITNAAPDSGSGGSSSASSNTVTVVPKQDVVSTAPVVPADTIVVKPSSELITDIVSALNSRPPVVVVPQVSQVFPSQSTGQISTNITFISSASISQLTSTPQTGGAQSTSNSTNTDQGTGTTTSADQGTGTSTAADQGTDTSTSTDQGASTSTSGAQSSSSANSEPSSRGFQSPSSLEAESIGVEN